MPLSHIDILSPDEPINPGNGNAGDGKNDHQLWYPVAGRSEYMPRPA